MAISKLAVAALLGYLLVSSCAVDRAPDDDAPRASTSDWLFDAAMAIEHRWQHMPLRGATEYRLAVLDGRLAIRAIGRESASGLIRRVDIDPRRCPAIEWSWAVSRLQPAADLHVKELEDVAASVFLLFGDPGFVADPKPVPTLRYVWTNGNASVGEVIDNPYLPGIVRSMVVRAGNPETGSWMSERRDLVQDFTRAFGREPAGTIHAVALFTDNDQTKQPVEAYYGAGRVICAGPPAEARPVSID